MLHPEKFVALGIDPPKGVLCYGPPGTGDTPPPVPPISHFTAWVALPDTYTPPPPFMLQNRAEGHGKRYLRPSLKPCSTPRKSLATLQGLYKRATERNASGRLRSALDASKIFIRVPHPSYEHMTSGPSSAPPQQTLVLALAVAGYDLAVQATVLPISDSRKIVSEDREGNESKAAMIQRRQLVAHSPPRADISDLSFRFRQDPAGEGGGQPHGRLLHQGHRQRAGAEVRGGGRQDGEGAVRDGALQEGLPGVLRRDRCHRGRPIRRRSR